MKALLVLPVSIALATSVIAQNSTGTVRAPTQRSTMELRTPAGYPLREVYDPATGLYSKYDPKYEIVLTDPRRGLYSLRWIGSTGLAREVAYQRTDMIDVTVEARLVRESRTYKYVYLLRNLQSSALALTGFKLQTFSGDAVVIKQREGHVGRMRNRIPGFEYGSWLSMGPSFLGTGIVPGMSTEVVVTSASPPGLLQCRVVGGDITLYAAEDFPDQYEELISHLHYRIWPKGYTIGPVDSLRGMTSTNRRGVLSGQLDEYVRLGWIAAGLRDWYRTNLAAAHRPELVRQTRLWFEQGNVASEIVALIESIP
jgi:hypothetical protein